MEELVRWDQPLEIFPTSVSWNTIVRQYTIGPAEGVTLDMAQFHSVAINCSLIFQSYNAGATTLRLEASEPDGVDGDLGTADEEMGREVFC